MICSQSGRALFINDLLSKRQGAFQVSISTRHYYYTQEAGVCQRIFHTANHLLSRDAYMAQKAPLVRQCDDAHSAEVKIQAELFKQTRDRSIYWERYQLYADIEALPDDVILDLLDRVTVWPDGRLEVSLKFLDELPASVEPEWVIHNAE